MNRSRVPAGEIAAEQVAVERVVVSNHKVQIIQKVPATALPSESGEEGATAKIYTVALPAPRARAHKEIIIPSGREHAPRHINHALVLAIARAKTWMHGLRNGNYADTTEIARRFNLNDAHVRRLLRFGYLAPDIVEAIVEGRQPQSLTVKRLLQGIPCAWSEQRAAFGFVS
jgi:hypothetical protein